MQFMLTCYTLNLYTILSKLSSFIKITVDVYISCLFESRVSKIFILCPMLSALLKKTKLVHVNLAHLH